MIVVHTSIISLLNQAGEGRVFYSVDECSETGVACVAADSFPFSSGAEIEQANEKRASEGARLG